MGDGIAMVDLGQVLTSGARAYGCSHMRDWLALFTRLQVARGRIKRSLDIVQAYGWSDKSGGTHGQGTALDLVQTDAGIVADAREAGARGTWCRGVRWGQYSMGDHIHLALDCPCIAGSDYQIAAADAGYNGLGLEGKGGRDYHPAPKVRRDWRAGIDWMREQIAQMEDIMATLDELRAVVRQEIMDAQIKREGPGASGTTTLRTTLAYLDGNLGRVLSGQAPAVLASALGGALASAGVVVADLDALAADVAKRLTVTAG